MQPQTPTSTPSGGARIEGASTESVDEAQLLRSAEEARDLIAEAKQLVMARHGLQADEALELLRLYSRSCDRPLRDVALKIAHGSWLPAP